MGSIVFLPGILGSELILDGEPLWPPTLAEAAFGYHRLDRLADPGIVAGEPIRSVACFSVYGPLLRDLAAIASGRAGAPVRRLHAFGYDWRRDLVETAAAIAARLDALPPADTDEIHFVGHSMGCLVLRLLLECGRFDDAPWFGAVRGIVALAAPHRGAPVALVRAIGLEGSCGLAGSDIRRLAADPAFPALYQLLPAPGVAAIWDGSGVVTAHDPYDPAVAARLGLAPGNLARAAAMHATLARGRLPAHVPWLDLAGSGADTWTRLDLVGTAAIPHAGRESGDGTVPLWSAIDPRHRHHAAPATHEAVFRNAEIRGLLFRALGAAPPGTAFADDGRPAMAIFPTRPVSTLGRPVELLLVPDAATRRIDGELAIAGTTDPAATDFAPLARRPLTRSGDEITELRVRLPSFNRPGFYRVGFTGSHAVPPEAEAAFAVAAAHREGDR